MLVCIFYCLRLMISVSFLVCLSLYPCRKLISGSQQKHVEVTSAWSSSAFWVSRRLVCSTEETHLSSSNPLHLLTVSQRWDLETLTLVFHPLSLTPLESCHWWAWRDRGGSQVAPARAAYLTLVWCGCWDWRFAWRSPPASGQTSPQPSTPWSPLPTGSFGAYAKS